MESFRSIRRLSIPGSRSTSGEFGSDGQFDIVWSSDKAVRPIPYPTTRTRAEWNEFLDALFQRWGGNWANPASDKSRATARAG